MPAMNYFLNIQTDSYQHLNQITNNQHCYKLNINRAEVQCRDKIYSKQYDEVTIPVIKIIITITIVHKASKVSFHVFVCLDEQFKLNKSTILTDFVCLYNYEF